jgi:large subunit ribosomal protein L9
MKNVEVLLRENIKTLGKCGDVVRVKPGFARNYLMPRKLAVEANEDNKRAMARRRKVLDAEEAKRDAEVEARVATLAGVALKSTVRADEHGHLYGSVNAASIVALLAAAGHSFEERAVRLENPIKEVGTYTVRIHVHGDRFAEVQLVVEAEAAASGA